MNIEHMIGQMVLGSMGGRRKRSRRAARYLTGGGGSFLNASTLLTLGGLAWGVFETMQQQKAPTTGGVTPSPAGGFPPGPTGQGAGAPALADPARMAPPPLPGAPAVSRGPVAAPPDVPEGALRIVRLMLSAARADGTLTDTERETIMTQAKAAGLEGIVTRELAQPTPLSAILQGISDRKQREDLYVLAFSIARADESVTGAERIYLAQLAVQLGLDAATTARLEDETAAKIDQAANGDDDQSAEGEGDASRP